MCVGAFSKSGEIDEETVVLSHAIRMIMADANFFQLDFVNRRQFQISSFNAVVSFCDSFAN